MDDCEQHTTAADIQGWQWLGHAFSDINWCTTSSSISYTRLSQRLQLVTIHTTTTTPVQRPLFQHNLDKPVPERKNQSGFKWGKRWQGLGIAAASAGPYFQDNLGKPVPERKNQSGFKWGKRWQGLGIAAATAGPYANNLLLNPDR